MDTVLPAKTPNKKKYLIIAVVSIILIFAGVIAGLLLLGKRQLVEQEAAVPAGVAKVFITPESKTVNAGESFTANILFDTANTAISALTIQLEYSFSGDNPPVSVSDVQINSTLPVDELWDFPVKSIKKEGGKVLIKIAGFSNSVSGYTSTGQEILATVNFKAESPGIITAQFNPTESKITKKTDGSDTLLIPQSTGTYTVTGSASTATPTASANPTSSPTSTPTTRASATPVSGATPAPIPVTGISIPAILGIGTGLILIIGAALITI